MLNEQPSNAAKPLPTTLSATEKALANRLLIVDRRFQYLQEQIDRQAFELQFERSERQGEVDALSKHFSSEITEIRAAQTADGYQMFDNAADIAQLKSDLDNLDVEEVIEIEFVRSRFHQSLKSFAYLLIGIAAGAIAMNFANNRINANVNAADGIVQTSAEIHDVCKSTQASYYNGLGLHYPITQAFAEVDCFGR